MAVIKTVILGDKKEKSRDHLILIEVFKKLVGKFGGGNGSKFSGGGSNFNKVGISLVFGVLAAIWVVSGFYTVKESRAWCCITFWRLLTNSGAGSRLAANVC